jgi:tetratricopeptide (TPR) repeat protein
MRSWGVKAFSLSLILALLAGGGISQTAPSAPSGAKSSHSEAQLQVSSAQALIKAGKFTQAAAIFRQIISREDTADGPGAHAGLVRCLLKLDDVTGADEASALGMRAYAQSSLTQTARGDVRFREGAIMEAEELYQSALKVDAKNARAWLGMGRVDSALSRQAKAKQDFTRSHELDPGDGDALYYWSVGQPYPENVNGLERHLDEFHDDQERERHEREYLAFLKALAGRKVWTLAHDVE